MKRISIVLIFSFLLLSVSAQTKGTLALKFTTKTYGGQYANKHILAAWITNSATNNSTTYIKTMNAYYQDTQYVSYLVRWKAATNSTYNKTDATTGATLTSHGQLSGQWNSLNTLSAAVPDGTYYIWVEFSEESTPKYATFSFTKSGTATTTFTTVTSSSWITMNSIAWTPTNTAVKEVPAGKNYKIYPNPVVDNMTITGSAINEVVVYNAVGKRVFSTKQNKINFSKFPKGNYVIEIKSDDGTFYRKAMKE